QPDPIVLASILILILVRQGGRNETRCTGGIVRSRAEFSLPWQPSRVRRGRPLSRDVFTTTIFFFCGCAGIERQMAKAMHPRAHGSISRTSGFWLRALALIAIAASPVIAQEGHPVKGSWLGTWSGN